jgi:hypothetical protein
MPLVDPLSPARATVHVRHFRAGAEAAEIVHDMVEGMGAQAVRHSTLPIQIFRETTRLTSHGLVERQAELSSGI